MKEWKINQQLYARLMSGRHSDIMHPEEIVEEGVVRAESGLKYIRDCSFPLYQPSKSRMVAIIYAYLLGQHFNEDFYTVLNDPDLFLGEDPYFKPYSEDIEGYDLLIKTLGPYKEWKTKGWALRTNQYFWLECTNDGIEFVSQASDEDLRKFFDKL